MKSTKRLVAMLLAVAMALGMLPAITLSIAANEADTATNVIAPWSDAVAVNGELTETVWATGTAIEAAETGDPAGAVAAAWDKDNLYLSVRYVAATELTVTAGNVSAAVDLAAGTVTGIGTAAVKEGAAELSLPWKDLGVTLLDYGQVISGLNVKLASANAESALDMAVTVSSTQANSLGLSGFSTHGDKAALTVTDDSVSINTSALNHAKIYKNDNAIVDHTKDLLLVQDLCFTAMPTGTGLVANTALAQDAYFVWICDKDDRKANDGKENDNGTGVMYTVYRPFADSDELYLRLHDGSNNVETEANKGIALGKKLGDSFRLALLWGADDSVKIYIDGALLESRENGTFVQTAWFGNKGIQIGYRNGTAAANAVISVSNIAMLAGGAESALNELTQEAVLGTMDLTDVETDLALPGVYAHEKLGDIPLTWTSSDPSVVLNDGTVIRPEGLESKAANLTLSVGQQQLWTVEVTVAPAASTVKIYANCADSISVDGALKEIYWVNPRSLAASGEGAPYGSVYTCYNRNGLYVGISAANASAATVQLNGKSFEAAVTDGVAEILVPWSDAGVTLLDYNQEVSGFQVVLTGENGTSSLCDGGATLVPTAQRINSVTMSGFRLADAGKMTATANAITWDTTASGDARALLQSQSFVEHDKDLVISQNYCFTAMPAGNGWMTNEVTVSGGMAAWICDLNDRGDDDGVKNNTGEAILYLIYRPSADSDELYIRLHANTKYSENDNAGVPLGKKLGDKFNLTVAWNADDSAQIYVDGVLLIDAANATTTTTQYYGSKCIYYSYNSAVEGASSQITVDSTSVMVAAVDSVLEEITIAAMLSGAVLDDIQGDLKMEPVYASPYLGDIPVVWESSDESVITTDGAVTRPDSDESVDVTLKLYVYGQLVDEQVVTVTPAPPEVLGPMDPTPGKITTAFSTEEIVVDGSIMEEGWILNANILDADSMIVGKFGTQWQAGKLYVAARVRGVETLTVTLEGKTVTVNVSDLTASGDLTPTAIAKKGAYIEMEIPLSQLGIVVTTYDVEVAVTVSMDGSSYTGKLVISSVDWFAADNATRPLPVPTKGSVKIGEDLPVEGYQGYEQLTDAWRMYDLYNAEGENPAMVRTYLLLWNNDIYEPLADRSSTIYTEFDITIDAMPVYDMGASVAWSPYYACYQLSFFLADDDNSAKEANNVGLGVLNTESGLMLVCYPGTGSTRFYPLGREVGDTFRLAVEWKTNGDVVFYLDGEYFITYEGLEAVRTYYGDKTLGFNLIRNGTAAASEADNMDVTISNIAIGHSYDHSLLDALTFDTIRQDNLTQDNITADLYLPQSLSNSQLTDPQKLTWTSSDPSAIDPATGKVNRPATGAAEVTLTATLPDGSAKTFELTVMGGSFSSGNVLIVENDLDPHSGSGVHYDQYRFTLDENNNSVIIDLKEKQTVNVARLRDGDSAARLNEDVLTLWISDDNVTYTQIKDFKLLHDGQYWYLYDFEAQARYVKVHCTHFDGEEADFIGSAAQMLTAYRQDVFGAEGEFESTASVVVANTTGVNTYDRAWTVSRELAKVIGSDASIRVYLGDELLYHYVSGGNIVVRIPEIAKGGSVTLTVLSGNDSAMDISNKEYVYEVTYGSKEAQVSNGRMHWIFKMADGTILTIGESGSKLWYAHSYDGGYNWTGRTTISCSDGFISEGGGFIYDSHTGRIMFQGHYVVSWNGTDMSKSDCKTNIIYSDDGGYTWDRIGTVQTDRVYALSYTDGIELSCYDGEGPNVDFVFPIGAQYDNNSSFCCVVAYSTDAGLTWQTGNDLILYQVGSTTHEGGVSECTIQERADGTLVLLGRNQGFGIDNFVQSYSYDHGITWVTPGKLSSVYTVNTQPIMFKHNGQTYLTWGGNNMLGGESRIRAPYSIGVTFDEMETFRNIQDLYVKYSLQGMTRATMNRITNQSVQITDDGDLITVWWNQAKNGIVGNTMYMRIQDFEDYFYRTKGAYDSFEHGTVRYEGWEASSGYVTLSDEQASDGSYAMKMESAVNTRSVPTIQDGTVSVNVWVDANASFSLELQSAFSTESGKGAPVGISVRDGKVYFLHSGEDTGLTLREGWNTLTFELELLNDTPAAAFSINGGEAAAMPVNAEIGDYVNWITFMTVGTVYADELLVESDVDALNMLDEANGSDEEDPSDPSDPTDPSEPGSEPTDPSEPDSGEDGKPGDNTNLVLLIAILVVGVLGIAALIAVPARKKY